MSPVLTVTRDELVARRERVLAELGMTGEEFIEFAATHSLDGKEWEALEELESIAFLLGEDI